MHLSALKVLLSGGCLAAALVSSACVGGDASAREIGGAELYAACATCHGAAGEGSVTVGAPRIAGLPAWYVTAQLERFQGGLRGKHPDDVEGLRMRPMSRQMLTPAETSSVAQHIAGLTPVPTAASLPGGEAAKGQEIFVRCVACHGMKGEGSEALKAPPLAGMDDWYVARQLQKFRAGIRGAAPGDTVGPIMQAMAQTIQPEEIDHVAAYVHTLAK
jgi:cytochrome c553